MAKRNAAQYQYLLKQLFLRENPLPLWLGADMTTVTMKLRLYLAAMSIDGSQTVPAIFYEYSTRELPQASGFSIGSSLSNLSCYVQGMALDYSGPLK